ncbi:peptidylprolyl isomerase [Methylopila jiangsuensis]|uniref:Parvulin-like PPIase n=1 Tax=Methylopila jiangsuensis TaxID=586230 RepID=A0A9W6JF19_9HYPH|nr:SurA N-terminal domain-containing protein [Methylopila jiangsuensis]MDR6286059.1 peptidyl-prolyl cis-trans isomerase D [Methylopila jiangsuensis]GLK75817.1 peptidylprolyl isomerase [Methylopila jiangsuensis]
MLQVLRKGAAGWVAKIFLGVLVLSFAVWGVADVFRTGGSANVAASVGEQQIPLETFRRAYQGELRRLSEEAKRPITPEIARMAGLGDRVLNNLINEAALDESVRAFKLSVSDDEVAREITTDPIFRGLTGSFDRARFTSILNDNNLREQDYVMLQRGFTARRQITDALTDGVQAPAVLREALHAYESESRTLSYVTLPLEAPAAVPAPSDSTLKNLFEDKKASFAAPEYRKLATLTLDAAAIAADKQVPEAELRAYYDQNRPRYVTAEKRSIEQIAYPSLAEAKAASDRIKAGGLFEQEMIARKISPQDAFLGDLTKAQVFDKKIAEVAFALQPNTVSEPVEGAYATVLLRVTGVQQEQVRRFEDVRGDIRRAIAEAQAKDELRARHDAIDEARLGGQTLAEIAKAQKLTLRTIDAVDANGLDRAGQPVTGLATQADVLKAAFEAQAGSENPAVAMGEAYVWYDVLEVSPARERTFEEAKPLVETRWRAEETRKRLVARADQIVADLKGGKTLEQAAQAHKLEVDQTETTRLGGAPAVTQDQAAAIFQTPVDGFGKTPPGADGSRLVYKVTAENTRPFDPKAADTTGQAAKIAEGLGGDVVTSFVRRLRDDLGARIDQGAVARVVGAGEG